MIGAFGAGALSSAREIAREAEIVAQQNRNGKQYKPGEELESDIPSLSAARAEGAGAQVLLRSRLTNLGRISVQRQNQIRETTLNDIEAMKAVFELGRVSNSKKPMARLIHYLYFKYEQYVELKSRQPQNIEMQSLGEQKADVSQEVEQQARLYATLLSNISAARLAEVNIARLEVFLDAVIYYLASKLNHYSEWAYRHVQLCFIALGKINKDEVEMLPIALRVDLGKFFHQLANKTEEAEQKENYLVSAKRMLHSYLRHFVNNSVLRVGSGIDLTEVIRKIQNVAVLYDEVTEQRENRAFYLNFELAMQCISNNEFTLANQFMGIVIAKSTSLGIGSVEIIKARLFSLFCYDSVDFDSYCDSCRGALDEVEYTQVYMDSCYYFSLILWQRGELRLAQEFLNKVGQALVFIDQFGSFNQELSDKLSFVQAVYCYSRKEYSLSQTYFSQIRHLMSVTSNSIELELMFNHPLYYQGSLLYKQGDRVGAKNKFKQFKELPLVLYNHVLIAMIKAVGKIAEIRHIEKKGGKVLKSCDELAVLCHKVETAAQTIIPSSPELEIQGGAEALPGRLTPTSPSEETRHAAHSVLKRIGPSRARVIELEAQRSGSSILASFAALSAQPARPSCTSPLFKEVGLFRATSTDSLPARSISSGRSNSDEQSPRT